MVDAVWSLYGKAISGTQASVDPTPFRWTAATAVWSPETDGPAPAREGGGSANNGVSKLLYVSGTDASSNGTNDSDEYSVVGSDWTAKTNYPQSRRAPQMELVITADGQLMVGGHVGATEYDESYFHSITDDTWSSKAAPGIQGHFVHCGVCPTEDDKLNCFSGNGWGTSHKTWDASGNDWTARAVASADISQVQPWASANYLHHSGNSLNNRYSQVNNLWTARTAITGYNDSGGAANLGNAYGIIMGGGTGTNTSIRVNDTTNTVSSLGTLPENRCYSGGVEEEIAIYASAAETVDPFDTLDPIVNAVHAQAGSGHGAGDGFALDGGIVAGTTSFYVDYDSIIEVNPEETRFSYQYDVAGVDDVDSSSSEDTTDTTTPAPDQFAGLISTGAARVTVAVEHEDKFSQTDTDTSAYYYVKPYANTAPTVNNWDSVLIQVDVNVNPHGSEHADVDFYIICTTGDAADVGKYVQGDGSLGVAAVWADDATWGTKTIQLTSGGAGTVGFKTKSRNYYQTSLESDLSSEGTVGATTPPVISNLTAAQQADGTVLISVDVQDIDDNDCRLKIEIKETTTGNYGDFVETLAAPVTVDYGLTPDVANGNPYQVGTVTGVDTSGADNTVTFRWDCKTDQDGEEDGYTIKVTVNDGSQDGTPLESAETQIDTLDPAAIDIVLQEATFPSGGDTATLLATWTETNPNTNHFGVRLNGAGGWTELYGDVNTASPAAKLMTFAAAYNGDDLLNFRCIHTDDFSNATTQEGTPVGCNPLAPPALTLSNAAVTTLDFAVNENGGDPAAVLKYAIHIDTGGNWVQADGSVGGAAVYQTKAVWGTDTVTGLTPYVTYTLYAVAQNPNDASALSPNGATASLKTLTNDPDIQTVVVTIPTDGSKLYEVTFDIRDEYQTNLVISLEYDVGAGYVSAVAASGDFGAITYDEAWNAWDDKTLSWNAGTDIPDTEYATTKVRVTVTNPTTGTANAASANFNLDTLDPTLGGALTVKTPDYDSTELEWSQAAVDDNFDTYELYISTVSMDEAVAKTQNATCFLWDKVDDTTLALKATQDTDVDPLVELTTYYTALFALDTFGNYSAPSLQLEFQTRGLYGLSGKIYDQNGYSVPDVDVYLYDKSDGSLIESILGNPDGSFEFTGPYDVDNVTYYLLFYRQISATVYWGAGVIDEIVMVKLDPTSPNFTVFTFGQALRGQLPYLNGDYSMQAQTAADIEMDEDQNTLAVGVAAAVASLGEAAAVTSASASCSMNNLHIAVDVSALSIDVSYEPGVYYS